MPAEAGGTAASPTAPRVQPPAAARIRAFDLARGLAVLFMILVHVLAQYGTDAAWASPIGQVVLFFGGPTGAPVFMFLMGASLAFSRRTTFAGIARKGVWLLFLAYTLNVLRAALPATLGLATGFVSEADIAPYTPLTSLLLVDIHQMAGLALFVLAAIAGLAALGLPARALASVTAVVVAFAAPAVAGLTTGIGPLDFVLLLVWGTEWYVFFPLFPWVVYPLVGFVYGRTLVRAADRTAFIRRSGLVGVGLIAVAVIGVGLLDPLSGRDLFFRPSPLVLTGFIGLVLAWVALADVVVGRVRGGAVLRILDGWSIRVTSMYCIHWILIGWGVALVGRRQLDVPALLVAMLVVLVATDRITLAVPFLRGPGARARGRAADRDRAADARPALVPAEA